MLVNITPIAPIGQDERGFTTEIELIRSGKALVVFRKQGVEFGNHYHTGKEPNKNPEILWHLNGSVKLEYRHIDSETWESAEVHQCSQIEIFANTIHKVTAFTDCVMLELNSLQEHINDTERF